MSIKQDVMKQLVASLEQLPDDASLDEIEYHTAFVLMIQRRRAEARAGLTISHEEARERLKSWLA